jgi:hypothetical protein
MEDKKVAWPVDVRPFFDEARKSVLRVVHGGKVRLLSAILDDWNTGVDRTGGKLRGPRIIWGPMRAVHCWHDIACENCPMFKAVGADIPENMEPGENSIRASLCTATEDYLRLLPTRQRFLNCKLFYQYTDAFIAFFLSDRCISAEEIEAEVVWVKRFRLLYLDGLELAELVEREAGMKREVFSEVINKLNRRGEVERARLVRSFVEKYYE